jgi:tetratricopeptide (TPR) repeat protein
MTHVINLQQTEFNIPHWYTEALAVESERSPRPQEWNKLLQERVPARKLLNLDTINLGFIRPSEPNERQMAYCQAQLYAQYMVKRFGDDAQIKLLDAYRRGLTTADAVTDSFGVDKADFEKGYLEFLDKTVKSINTRVENEEKLTFTQWEKKLEAKPDDPVLNARMAYEHFARRDYKEAAPFANKALKLDPRQPLASYVKARLFQSIGDDDSALELLKSAFDPESPNERVVDLLAELQMKAGELDEAEKLYDIARKDDPFQSKWIAGLARVQLRRRQQATTPEAKKAAEGKLLDALALLAANDADDIDVRKNLAEAHFGRGEFDKAAQWATECLYIDVNDPVYHVQLADALAGGRKYPEAIEEYETALTIKPKKPNDIRVKLAQAQLDAGKLDEAKATLEAILKADPEHPGAKALKEKLGANK